MDHQILVPYLEQLNDEKKFSEAFAIHVSLDRAWQVDDWELSERDKSLLDRAVRGISAP
jgi:hypothetical protein